MYRFLATSLLFFVMTTSVRGSEPITVMSFNIRYDGKPGVASDRQNAWLAKSGKHRRDLVVRAINDADPDILCVQEALQNQVADLKSQLADYEFYGVGRDDGVQKGEHCGIFYRRDRLAKLDQGNFWLNEDSETAGTKFPGTCCARLATWVMLKDKENSGREFLLINTHWDHQVQAAREFSAQLIQQKLVGLADGRPVLLTGDLNARPKNPAFKMLHSSTSQEKTQLVDCYREAHPDVNSEEATFNGFRGNTTGSRIDYVLRSSGFHTQSAEILRTHEGDRYPSDHYPVIVTLVLDAN